MSQISENYKKIISAIEETSQKSNRERNSVNFLAVTKGQSIESILELLKVGQKQFSENYVQEWKEKKEKLKEPIEWHFTGRLQKNKVKYLVGQIELFHSIDRLELAEKMNQIAKTKNLIVRGFLELNLGNEESKGGIDRKSIQTVFEKLNLYENLSILGLMILPPYCDDPEASRPYFIELKEILFDLNQKNIYKTPLTELSMGTSHDFKVAIEEGATWVRIGRGLFQ